VHFGQHLRFSWFNFEFCIFICPNITEEFEAVAVVVSALNFYFKEILFLCICFYEAALINEKSDKLAVMLTENHWKDEIETVRLSLVCNILAKPISFYLLGTRLKKKDIILQIMGVSVTTAIGIIKGIVEKQVR
jgi:hypothetical protein